MTPSLEASREVAGVGEIGVAEGVVEGELDLRIGGGRFGEPLARSGGGRGGEVRIGARRLLVTAFEAEFIVVEEELVGLESEAKRESE